MTDSSTRNLPAAPLSPAERQALANALSELLAQQIHALTRGQSGSVPVEVAQSLMESLCLSLGLAGHSTAPGPDPAAARRLLAARQAEIPDSELLRAGERRMRTRMALARQLWRTANATVPLCANQALTDTLRSIGAGFARYNPRFYAQELAMSIDYPLCVPVPETLQGPFYLSAWLKNLTAEHALLARLPAGEVCATLELSCPDPQGQLVNVCEPAAIHLLGRALLGEPPAPGPFTPAEQQAMERLWDAAGAEHVALRLQNAADRTARELGLSGLEASCLSQIAQGLAPRLRHAVACGGLKGVFPGSQLPV
ncbi:DUF6179 domain-containing protein [Gemmiger sp.]|uniref:DUF6179 domain-containing protein n=1 Tax=Gemmiger sp. TaxID=2049027 RepID=UPI003EFFE7CB